MRQETRMITVRPGDVGTKICMLRGWRDAYQRPIREHRVKLMVPIVKVLAEYTQFVLATDADAKGVLYILDGQHRFEAFVMSGQTVKIRAEVRHMEGNDGELSVANQYLLLNRGLPATPEDGLCNFQKVSHWSVVFAAHGLHPSYKRIRARFSWRAILNGQILALRMQEAKSILPGKVRTTVSADEVTGLWLGVGKTGKSLLKNSDYALQIRNAACAAQWWQEACDLAWKAHHVRLTSQEAIAFAILVRAENKDHPALKGLAKQIAAWPRLSLIGSVKGGDILRLLLRAANYRKRRQLVIFGETGAE
jgi:hypothetical protein